MAIREQDGNQYTDTQSDLPDVIRSFSADQYPATHFADAKCHCGENRFELAVDETEGAAVRTCVACQQPHPIGDSQDYLAGATLESCECLCGSSALELTIGVALYSDSQDVRWIYLAGRCPQCHCAGCYADWKNEFPDYQALLSRI